MAWRLESSASGGTPPWQHKLAGLEGRLTNLDTYYQVKADSIVLRFVV